MENTEFASVDAFNFDSMVEAVGIDPFAQEANKYAKDERFYTLTKDKDGNGAALIRFLPDSEKSMIKKMFKINTTVVKNNKKRFVNEYSPATIGQPCPFQEEWQRLWNAGDKEKSRIFGRSVVYVANIKILKDPKAPENEGKIFLYQFSGAMNSKLENAMKPSEDDISLGKKAKQVFNPLSGNSVRLTCSKGANGQINYDATEIVPEVDGIYDTVEEAVNDIKENTYKLSDLTKPESFMSYEKLKEKFNWVTFKDQEVQPVAEVQVAQPTTQTVDVQPAQPAQTEPVETQPAQTETQPTQHNENSLDSLLDGLV
jgi:hypothetical protein